MADIHGKGKRRGGEQTTWRKPDYEIVETSMEATAYFLSTR
ncbi:pyrroloquinoline quinone precursor peptide PqqA [Actinoallomurus spadix]|uniref:Coenzyme PQQ synthesis protein A n=1 Tax=Actinoallomurus spadix TaxID=79912 RepID=A0ABP3GT21_9ACTN|nr:pyrroloquinoline quinone precursor peptide PqqA [Actinoallomurus spadix]MCO5989029.1 pyrroloquinoline quinone precursor peptide PqqA [Actinoallomurus spadix]